MRFSRPNFGVVADESDDRVLTINDLGPWDCFATITNAAELVVKDLNSRGMLRNGRRLVYYDSEGYRAELLVVDGRFGGFNILEKGDR